MYETKVYSLQNGLTDQIFEEVKDSFVQNIPVVVPTETVYGLAAPYNNEECIKNIFKIKNRPTDNPLIAHIGSFEQIKMLSTEIIESKLQNLLDSVWPGPLTVLLEKRNTVSDFVTGKTEYVGVRMPNQPDLLELINHLGLPLVAPSANLSGKPSPTVVSDALEDLEGKVKVVLDGGMCDIGLESTVIRVNQESNKVTILRPGFITKEDLLKFFDTVEERFSLPTKNETHTIKSPGQKYPHYKPLATVIPFTKLDIVSCTKKDMVLCVSDKWVLDSCASQVHKFANELELSRNLFRLFREADRQGLTRIFVEQPIKYSALKNRLEKASL